MKHKSFYLLAILLTLFSCRLGTEYVRQEGLAPSQYKYTVPQSENIADVDWWDLFQDPTLISLIEDALQNNLDLSIAYSRIKQAESQIDVVRANLFPRVNYGGAGNYNITTEGDQSAVTGLVPIAYQVDLWGRFRNLSDAEYYNFLATEEAYRSITISLVSSVANAYFLLRDLDNRLIISENTLESWDSNLDITTARFNAGLVSEVDVNQARIQVEEARSSIQTFKRLRAQTENGISILLGVPPMEIERGIPLQEQVLPPVLPTGIPSELLDRRPDLRAAEYNLQAQYYRAGATEALQYPSLTITADLGASFLNPALGFANLGSQLFGPIFNSEENKRRYEIELERTEQLFYEYKSIFINSIREVEDAMVAVETYREELEARKRQVNSANRALDLAWVRYQNGVTSYLEILDLQRSSFNSMLKASETMQLNYTSTVNLYQALGGGWNYATDSIPRAN